MRWNQAAKVDRPEFPKLIPISGDGEEIKKLLTLVQTHDPQAAFLDGGKRGAYIRVHNADAAAAASSDARVFPLR